MTGHSDIHHDQSSRQDGHIHRHGAGEHCHHSPKVNASNRWRVGIAAILTGTFMLAEVAGGLISGSLALLADAGHMLTDFAALSMAWWAFRLASRPANARYTYGYDRVTILVAFVNGLTLFAVAAWVLWEAYLRFFNAGEILAGTMLWVAALGLVVNLIVFWILLGADQENLNIRGAVLHVIGDLLGSIAAILAAIIILTTGWTPADPLLSVLVALLILRSAWTLIKDSAHIMMQGTPIGINRREIEADLMAHISGLTRIEDLQIWSLTHERRVMTLAANMDASAQIGDVSGAIKARLAQQFQIDEVTVEIRSGPTSQS